MPYFHASIADFEEGSSFELWCFQPRRVLLVPGPKCSAVALLRFHNYLLETFSDVEIREYEPEEIAT